MGRYKKEVGVRSAFDPAGPYLENTRKLRKELLQGGKTDLLKTSTKESDCSTKTDLKSTSDEENNLSDISGTQWKVVDLSAVGGCDFEETLEGIFTSLDAGGRLAFVGLSKEQRAVVHRSAHFYKCKKTSRADSDRGVGARMICVEKSSRDTVDRRISAASPSISAGYPLSSSKAAGELQAAGEAAGAGAATTEYKAEASSPPRKSRWRRAAADPQSQDLSLSSQNQPGASSSKDVHLQNQPSASTSKDVVSPEPSTRPSASSFKDGAQHIRACAPICRDQVGGGRICVVWLRDDMRLHDNPALCYAAETGFTSVVPVFIDDSANRNSFPLKGAAVYWKHESLRMFSTALSGLGSQLIVRQGDPTEEILGIFNELLGSRPRAGCVVAFNRRPQRQHQSQDEAVAAALQDHGVSVESFPANVLYEPWDLQPIEHWQKWRARVRAEDAQKRGLEGKAALSGEPRALEHVSGFGSYRFFHHALEYHGPPKKPCASVRQLPSCPSASSMSLDDLGYGKTPGQGFTSALRQCCLKPNKVSSNWAAGIKNWWEFGEAAALRRLDAFLDGILSSGDFEGRKRLISDQKNTSELSPYIRFGELSVRFVYWKARQRNQKTNQRLWAESEYLEEGDIRANATFLRRFFWRDLTYWFLWEFPTLPTTSMRIEYETQIWAGTKKQLQRWKSGNTGFPLVDAAMRQLWAVGWMPNYLRHVVAQTLIEYLDVSWKEGLSWFDWTLVDADLAINSFMWQNGGHSGPDHWQFVLHPVNAAKTADPDGSYVRRWLPCLSELPAEFIHRPWEAPLRISRAIHIEMYPKRVILDLNEARRAHTRRVIEVRRKHPQMVARNGHEWLRLPGCNGLLAKLVTRNEFRAETEDFLMEQTPARHVWAPPPGNAQVAILEECVKSSSSF